MGACEKFARLKPPSSFEDLWYFAVGSSGGTLIVGVDVEATGRKRRNGWPIFRSLKVNCAILSTCWWETYEPSHHKNAASYAADRAHFDRLFLEALEKTAKVIGGPLREGVKRGKWRHRWAIWRGETALLVLQQSAYDLQF